MTEQQLEKLVKVCREFIDENRVSCAEACAEDDVYVNAPNLVYEIAEIVGYYKYPDEE